ncbi:hypothetical protein H2200_004757 [Cladophialophora chaetospira]|uniref:Tetrapyrrole biosynthesis uroporphyrinogen III synthase domain-containing protein n=1 Tax=Cladophialophora chaetospira TaxID=386627 RepID=A0AA38XDP9_9EURO|nr:hypothetical protein H2200_004757 [Cladophialophora chaetospira]
MPSSTSSLSIPVLLLKTRSQPHDAYAECFSDERSTTTSSSNDGTGTETSTTHFSSEFVPVLEHKPNSRNLGELQVLLKSGRLAQRYGGMIFTSQRAVEAWADVVRRVQQERDNKEQHETNVSSDMGSGVTETNPTYSGADTAEPLLDGDFLFPLYTVGPATSRALHTLVIESSSYPSSQFTRLRPAIYGEHTGNGDALAQYILHHYNTLHSQRLYTFYEAPRLPFTPLIGPPRGERIEENDERLRKKPLLFLVGEQRRDIIPRTLMDTAPEQKLPPGERIQVDEMEVYITATMGSFEHDFQTSVSKFHEQGKKLAVVVVFSPQGCEAMLRSLGYIDEEKKLTELASRRWNDSGTSTETETESRQRYIIVTIGPTTRDHLKNRYGFDADVCAAKPSPEGVMNGVKQFLSEKRLL